MIPWYIPIIAGIVTGLIAWFTRGCYDRRAERSALIKEIYNQYMDLTDSEPWKHTSAFRLYALQRSGALRLENKEFDKLIHDLEKTGRPAPVDDDLVQIFGLRRTLETASKAEIDLREPQALFEWLLLRISEAHDMGDKSKDQIVRRVLSHIEKE